MDGEVVLHLPEDIHKLCRTCMSVTDNVISHDILLFDESKVTIAGEMMNFCFAIKPKINDGLPKSICDECAAKLEAAYNFKNQCEQTENGLRKLLNISVTEPTKENTSNVNSYSSKLKENEKNTANEIDSLSKGIVLFESNIQKDLDQSKVVSNKDDINIEGIFLQNKFENNLNYGNNITHIKEENDSISSLQNDVLKLIEERKKVANKNYFDPLNDYDDILALIEERKCAKTINNIKVKEEIVSDNEDDTKLICSDSGIYFKNIKDFEDHTQICNNQDDIKIQVLENIKVENNDQRPKFACNFCHRDFLTRHARNIHMAIHTNNSVTHKISCVLCNKGFPSESKLITHFYKHIMFIRKNLEALNCQAGEFVLELENETDMLTCNTCDEDFKSIEELKKHTNEHMNTEIQCEICNKSFVGELAFAKHLHKHDIHVSICKICLKRFEDPLQLKEHEKHHLESTKIECPICKMKFSNIRILKNHSITHLEDIYSCDRCSRHFNNKVVYEAHMKQHFEPRFLCPLCGKQYFSNATLECHIRSHTNEKPFECIFCKKRFTSRATLSIHKRIHSNVKPYVCSYCGYSCRQSGDLQMHIRTHTGVKPYKCKFPNCDRKFTTSSQRMEHHRRHTNERNHKCEICKKAFLESKTLKVHMLTHTGEKPHECKVCGKCFRRTHHLANHMKSHKDQIEIKME